MEMQNVRSHLSEFAKIADDYYGDDPHIAKRNRFVQEFFQPEKLEALEAEDIEELGNMLDCFLSLAVARAAATVHLKHPLPHYRKSFAYLAHGEDDLDTRIDRFYKDEEYKLRFFGKSATSEILAYLFPDHFSLYNSRDQWAMEFLGIEVPKKRGASFSEQLRAVHTHLTSVRDAYEEIVGRKTDLPLTLEVDQFFNWLYETYSEKQRKITASAANTVREPVEESDTGEGRAPAIEEGVNYWTFAGGAGGEMIGEFLEDAIIAMGGKEIGDLKQYPSSDDIATAMHELYPDRGSMMNDIKGYHDFAHVMKPGDHILLKQGRNRLYAHGVVESDYRFEPQRDEYPHIRDVHWEHISEVTLGKENYMAIKTLTRVTRYRDFVSRILRQLYGAAAMQDGFVEPFRSLFRTREIAETVFDLMRQTADQLGVTDPESQLFRVNFRHRKRSIRFIYGGWTVMGFTTLASKKTGLSLIFERDKVPELADQLRWSMKDSGPRIGMYRVDLTTFLENEQLQQLYLDALDIAREKFSGWRSTKGISLNIPELCRAIFDEGYRDQLYANGIEVTDEEIDEEEELEGIEEYTREMALSGLFFSDAEFDSMMRALQIKKNIVLQGPPGVGKTFIAKRLAYSLMGEKAESRVKVVQFHQSYSYEDFIQGYRPTAEGGFVLKDGIFHEFCAAARRQPEKKFVLVIDEINRGNLSKIFGELLMLIEADKRGEEHKVTLAYAESSDDFFYIPENIYLIGTMNTADRSLAIVDYALRRRFRFITLYPQFTSPKFRAFLLDRRAGEALLDSIITKLQTLNETIANDAKNLGPGYQVGHSYFCPPIGTTPTAEWYATVIEHEIAPLLEEYWFDDNTRVRNMIESLRLDDR